MKHTHIRFESVSGESLQRRFNTLVRYYTAVLSANGAEWTAKQLKQSLIATIERGTVVITQDGQNIGLA